MNKPAPRSASTNCCATSELAARYSPLALARELIARPSVTPADAGCQELMIQRLQRLDFHIERLPFGQVSNFWARRGSGAPLVVFAGHTDVVPPGPLEAWKSGPFEPVTRNGMLYGRGAADMKSSLAAFVTAIEAFVARHPDHGGSLGLLITSDEEGPALDGTARVMEHLTQAGVQIDFCIVGEPTATATTGDVIKNGRRGSLGGDLHVHGKQGHVAYPQLAANPIHLFNAALGELLETIWDTGSAHFPATTFQVSNIHAGTGAGNVIPGTLEAQFNFRFSSALDETTLRERVEAILTRHGIHYDLHWTLSGRPFFTPPGTLTDAVRKAVRDRLGREVVLSTDGGTSDGRFIAPTGAQVVELGPPNTTIHQVDECIAIAELDRLHELYTAILKELLTT